MDSDKEMTDGIVGEVAHATEPCSSVVDIVRNLDRRGPGEDGQNLALLWRALSENSDGQFHAAEQSSLRCLLRMMNPSSKGSPNHEILRRWPLTWNILGHIFNKIPLLHLAPALTDRQFMIVLQHAVKDISKPTNQGEPVPPSHPRKRKRNQPMPFDVEVLRRAENCTNSAEAMFGALQSILARLEQTSELSPWDAAKAQQIKHLFCSPAEEALKIVCPLFTICKNATNQPVSEGGSQKCWMEVISDIWDMHRGDANDAMKIAEELSATALELLLIQESQTGDRGLGLDDEFGVGVSRIWGPVLNDFLQRHLILPARDAFIMRESFTILEMTITRAEDLPPRVFQTIYRLAQACPMPSDAKTQDKVHVWMNEILKAIDGPLGKGDFETRSPVMKNILKVALDSDTKISKDTLKGICTNNVFGPDGINWAVLSTALRLNPDILFDHLEDAKLLDLICGYMNDGTSFDSSESKDVKLVADAIVMAFINAKDLYGFFKLWYEQLGIVEDRTGSHTSQLSPWFDSEFRYGGPGSHVPKHAPEHSMTVGQLVEFLNWLASEDELRPGPAYVVLDSLACSLSSPEFTDVASTRIVDIVVKSLDINDVPKEMKCLRWAILTRVLNWLTPDARDRLWEAVGPTVTSVLKTGGLDESDHLNAFKFLFAVWTCMIPNGKYKPEVASAALKVSSRLCEDLSRLSDQNGRVGWPTEREELSRAHFGLYMDHMVSKSPRSIPSLFDEAGDTFPEFLDKAFSALLKQEPEPSSPAPQDFSYGGMTPTEELFHALLMNEDVLNSRGVIGHIIDRMTAAVNRSLEDRSSSHPLVNPRIAKLFLILPIECITKPQRRALLSIIFTRIRDKKYLDGISPSGYLALMAVVAKVLKKPTYYDGLKFKDLLRLAQVASQSRYSKKSPRPLRETRALEAMYLEVARSLLRQMTNDFENRGRKFFEDAAEWVDRGCTAERLLAGEDLDTALLGVLIDVMSSTTISSDNPSIFDVELAKQRLAAVVHARLVEYRKSWKRTPEELLNDPTVYPLLTTLHAAEVLDGCYLNATKRLPLEEFREWSDQGIRRGLFRGWKLRAFLLKHHPENTDGHLDLFGPGGLPELEDEEQNLAVFDAMRGKDLVPTVLECTDAVLQHLDASDRFAYLCNLIKRMDLGRGVDIQLAAVRRVVEQVIGLPAPESNDHDLTSAYNKIIDQACTVSSGAEFVKVCSILHFILESCTRITQCNVEQTLALAAFVCSTEADNICQFKHSRQTYEWLCKLVELILKKYRLRIEGHFQLLGSTLDALLRVLILNPHDPVSNRSSPRLGGEESCRHSTEHAVAYNRILTTVCEPTAGAVARSHGRGQTLDAAADVAKRAAGRRMHLILMTYVRLQMEVAVPRGVREALEPGMNAIFDIIPPEVRSRLADGLNRGGREILGDMYKRYRTFGKWSGK